MAQFLPFCGHVEWIEACRNRDMTKMADILIMIAMPGENRALFPKWAAPLKECLP
jgi:hypothetical protein